jgi:putative sugar O-methyltransferase
MDQLLRSMFDCFSKGDQIFLPSKFWEILNEKNIKQLEKDGIENLKQTVAQNYFTWVIGRTDEQFRFLLNETPVWSLPGILLGRPVANSDGRLSRKQRFELAIFTKMLWKFARRLDQEHLLETIGEPTVGNPFAIYYEGQLISQDLANSVLEYYAARTHFKTPNTEPVTFCELGAGYGRTAYVFLNAFPKGKYVIVDIPPALYVSQKYLASVFANKKIFAFRCFDKYSEIEQEFQEADIVFLLPHQASLLPEKCVDLFLNISSLHEMTLPQIGAYFALIDKLTRGYFYSKQWKISKNPADGLVISEHDYPVPENWRKLFSRQVKVQTHFFEAMYAITSGNLS